MKQVSISICVLFLLLCSAGAEDVASKPDPILVEIEQNLRVALAEIKTEMSFEYSMGTQLLTVNFRARKFMIHNGSMTGKFSEKAREVDGPSYEGFILTVHLQKAGQPIQAIVPQIIGGPYWETHIDVAVVENTDKQLFWGLSYGNSVDREFLKKIRIIFNALETSE